MNDIDKINQRLDELEARPKCFECKVYYPCCDGLDKADKRIDGLEKSIGYLDKRDAELYERVAQIEKYIHICMEEQRHKYDKLNEPKDSKREEDEWHQNGYPVEPKREPWKPKPMDWTMCVRTIRKLSETDAVTYLEILIEDEIKKLREEMK